MQISYRISSVVKMGWFSNAAEATLNVVHCLFRNRTGTARRQEPNGVISKYLKSWQWF